MCGSTSRTWAIILEVINRMRKNTIVNDDMRRFLKGEKRRGAIEESRGKKSRGESRKGESRKEE